MSTVLASSSLGIVIVTFPSSPSDISGLAGASSSFELTVASSDFSSAALAFAFTSSLFLSILAGIVTKPLSLSILIDWSVPSASFHLPFSFFAITVVVPNVISSSSVLSSLGLTTTLPSLNAFASGFLSFSTTVSACASCPVLPFFSTVTDPSFATLISLFSKLSVSLAAFTAATTLAFSSTFNEFLFSTGILAGATSLIVLSLSCASSTV